MSVGRSETVMRRWPRFLAAVVVLLAGCGSTHKPSTTTTSTASTPSTASPGTTSGTGPATTGSSPPSRSGSVARTVPASVRPCASSQLAGSLGSPNGTAGTLYYQLGLRNTSEATCLVQGYPGVSFVVDADG